MPELLVGLIVGIWMGVYAGFEATGAGIVGGIAAVLAYLGSCLIYPFRSCFICGGKQNVGDDRGNWRKRWTTCVWCKGAKDCRRLGARLIGRG